MLRRPSRPELGRLNNTVFQAQYSLMNTEDFDARLANHVNQLINSGRKNISIPASYLENVSPEALAEVRRLCKLTGVGIREIRLGGVGSSDTGPRAER